jgi:hypothetical protein
MKQHLLAFGGAAQDYSAGLVTVPVIPDPLIRSSGNVLQLNDNWDVSHSFFGGVGLTRVRLSSARSRIQGYPNLYPLQVTTTGGDNPIVNDIRVNPIKLFSGENVTIQATNGGAQATIGLINLTEPNGQYVPPPPGSRRIRFTAAPTSIAYAWSGPYNVTLDDDLEAGNYGIYGLSVYEATVLGARLILKDQVERPGCIANQTATQRPWPAQHGGLGYMGDFYSLVPPFIEVFANAAAAITVTGYLTVVKQR